MNNELLPPYNAHTRTQTREFLKNEDTDTARDTPRVYLVNYLIIYIHINIF